MDRVERAVDEMRGPVRARFADLAGRPGDAIPLAEAAFLIAAEEYVTLDVHAYLGRLDALADDIREAIDNAPDAAAASRVLARYLYDVQGMRGNPEDYYDPRNSFLNDVLDHRCGIPITLSILYMEVARRLGLIVQGIGLPGHFMVRIAESGGYVDPFYNRVDLTEADCADRLRELYGSQAPFDRSMLAPLTNREIVTRVLRNLLEIYRSSNDAIRAGAALDRMVLLNPESAQLRRERAQNRAQAGNYQGALHDLRQIRRAHGAGRRSERFRNWRRFVEEMAARMN